MCVENDQRKLTDRTIPDDVYAFGCLLWELFTGAEASPRNHPSGMNEVDRINWYHKAIVTDKIPIATDGIDPPAVKQLIDKCTAYEEKTRPTMDQVVDSLQAILKDVKGPTFKAKLVSKAKKVFRVLKRGTAGEGEYSIDPTKPEVQFDVSPLHELAPKEIDLVKSDNILFFSHEEDLSSMYKKTPVFLSIAESYILSPVVK